MNCISYIRCLLVGIVIASVTIPASTTQQSLPVYWYRDVVLISLEDYTVRIEIGRVINGSGRFESDESGDRMDGSKCYGTDGFPPSSEIFELVLFIGNERYEVDKRLWADCFEPNISTDPRHPMLRARLDTKFKRDLVVIMSASDGAGSYWVKWVFALNGKHTRVISYDEIN